MVKKNPSFDLESFYWKTGTANVIGVDEVGRGAFAGPIVAAGVIYRPNFKHKFLDLVNDSKLLKPWMRGDLAVFIKEHSIWTVDSVDIDFINKYGIGNANREVFKKIVKALIDKTEGSHFILSDGFNFDMPNSKAIIKGDQKSLSIASASIIAKVHRDRLMKDLSNIYSKYGFEKNVGYGTLEHRNSIKTHGLCDIHRTSFNLSKFL